MIMGLCVRMVSEAMGGAVEMEKLHEFPWVLHLSELKFQLQSNVIPIGMITRGIYCHRALLFKVRLTWLLYHRIISFYFYRPYHSPASFGIYCNSSSPPFYIWSVTFPFLLQFSPCFLIITTCLLFNFFSSPSVWLIASEWAAHSFGASTTGLGTRFSSSVGIPPPAVAATW